MVDFTEQESSRENKSRLWQSEPSPFWGPAQVHWWPYRVHSAVLRISHQNPGMENKFSTLPYKRQHPVIITAQWNSYIIMSYYVLLLPFVNFYLYFKVKSHHMYNQLLKICYMLQILMHSIVIHFFHHCQAM